MIFQVAGMKKKVMLVASSGGHWVQLNRLMPAFEGCEKIFCHHRA
jgi:hypothetical protein